MDIADPQIAPNIAVTGGGWGCVGYKNADNGQRRLVTVTVRWRQQQHLIMLLSWASVHAFEIPGEVQEPLFVFLFLINAVGLLNYISRLGPYHMPG